MDLPTYLLSLPTRELPTQSEDQKSESILKKFRNFLFKVRNLTISSVNLKRTIMKLHTSHFWTNGDCWQNNFFLRQLWIVAERDFVWISSFNWIKVRIMNCSISESCTACRAGVTESLELLEQVSTLFCAILEPFLLICPSDGYEFRI